MLARLLSHLPGLARLIAVPLNDDEVALFSENTFKDDSQKIPVRALYRELSSAGFTIWPINPKSTEHKLGLMWAINSNSSRITESRSKSTSKVKHIVLSAKEDSLRTEVAKIRVILDRVADKVGLRAMLPKPQWVAGGALAVFCGFETELFQLLVKKLGDGVYDIEQVRAHLEGDAECREINSRGIIFAKASATTILGRQ